VPRRMSGRRPFFVGPLSSSLPIGGKTRCVLAIICIVLFSRGVSVYPLCLLFLRSRRPISMPEQHVLWWGGLRGALALSLPHAAPLRDAIVVATFGVVVFAIVIQGLTMPLLLRQLGFLPKKI
jgi:monovalent cation:H+ antiporter, CPA1 family